MRIFRTAFVFTVTLIAVAAHASVASAGGRPDPPPGWLGGGIMVLLLIFGSLFISVVLVGAYRRRRP